MTKSRFLSSAAVLAASGGFCAAALAATPYSVKLKLPGTVKPGHTFAVKASGTSASTSHLTLFVSSKSCASSAKAESRSTHAVLSKNVLHSYTATKSVRASSKTGTYHACAYLTTGSSTRAHAAKKYFVGHLAGGY